MKNVIFDLGAVLLEWNPKSIVRNFTPDTAEQSLLLKEVFSHNDWLDMDRGILSEADFISRSRARLNFTEERVVELLSQTRKSLVPIKETEALLYQAHDSGKNLYCLSNMSVENYDHLKAELSFFERFTGIVISAQEKMAKPDPAIFALLLERFSLDSGDTAFIDDSPANVEAARSLGIHGIHFDRTDTCYNSIRGLLTTTREG